MSTTLNTVIEPNVLTDHTEVICSTSIERIVTGRNAALTQIEALIHQIADISIITNSIGGGVARDWAMKQDFRCGCWLMEKAETAMPVISADSIYSTFEQLHRDKGDVFERGVINVFKSLSWHYKTNSPCRFGKKVIVSNLVSYNKWGFTLNHSYRRDQLADLERMLHLLDGKPLPDNRGDVTVRLYEHISANRQMTQVYEDEYFSIKYFMKGSARLTFKKPALMDKMNDIIAKHYPGVLPERV